MDSYVSNNHTFQIRMINILIYSNESLLTRCALNLASNSTLQDKNLHIIIIFENSQRIGTSYLNIVDQKVQTIVTSQLCKYLLYSKVSHFKLRSDDPRLSSLNISQ